MSLDIYASRRDGKEEKKRKKVGEGGDKRRESYKVGEFIFIQCDLAENYSVETHLADDIFRRISFGRLSFDR